MKKKYLLVVTVLIVVMILWLVHGRHRRTNPVPTVNAVDALDSTQGIIPTDAQSHSTSKSSGQTKASHTSTSLLKGKTQVEVLNMMSTKFNVPINFYGKAVDQYGQPVPSAKVTASVQVIEGMMQERHDDYTSATDSNGNFSFLGLNGANLSVNFEKAGYEFRFNNSFFEYSNFFGHNKIFTPDPESPAILVLWKLKGPEWLIKKNNNLSVPIDGSITMFDLTTGKMVTNNGDVVIKFTRNSQHVTRGNKFDWKATLEAVEGGLVEVDPKEAYPNEAPVDGYMPSISIDMPVNSPNWKDSFKGIYYFKSRGGGIYGRMKISIHAFFDPPVAVTMDTLVNPSGSRNLEYDQNKQIDPSRVQAIGLEKAIEEAKGH